MSPCNDILALQHTPCQGGELSTCSTPAGRLSAHCPIFETRPAHSVTRNRTRREDVPLSGTNARAPVHGRETSGEWSVAHGCSIQGNLGEHTDRSSAMSGRKQAAIASPFLDDVTRWLEPGWPFGDRQALVDAPYLFVPPAPDRRSAGSV